MRAPSQRLLCRFALCSYVRNAQSGVVLTAVLPAIEAVNEYTGAQVRHAQALQSWSLSLDPWFRRWGV